MGLGVRGNTSKDGISRINLSLCATELFVQDTKIKGPCTVYGAVAQGSGRHFLHSSEPQRDPDGSKDPLTLVTSDDIQLSCRVQKQMKNAHFGCKVLKP